MRVVFMGTPELAARILDDLCDTCEVAGVFTRPDAVRGRGRKAVPSPVKELAESRGIPVFTPRSLKDPEAQAALEALHPDAICVVAYGALLPSEVLELPPAGCFNVHASLLPRWRGAAPLERAILAGDSQTGVCIMRMEEGLDTGPFCRCAPIPVDGRTLAELQDAVATLGSRLLREVLQDAAEGALQWTAQDEGSACYAPKISKGELFIAPADSTEAFLRKVRASSDAHPAKGRVAGRPLTVLSARQAATDGPQPPCGKAVFAAKRLVLGTADGAVELLEVKPDGKRAMDAAAFAAGLQGASSDDMEWEAYE